MCHIKLESCTRCSWKSHYVNDFDLQYYRKFLKMPFYHNRISYTSVLCLQASQRFRRLSGMPPPPPKPLRLVPHPRTSVQSPPSHYPSSTNTSINNNNSSGEACHGVSSLWGGARGDTREVKVRWQGGVLGEAGACT